MAPFESSSPMPASFASGCDYVLEGNDGMALHLREELNAKTRVAGACRQLCDRVRR
jgi:hypothetical protein